MRLESQTSISVWADASSKASEEVADIVIVLYRLAERLGIDLHDARRRSVRPAQTSVSRLAPTKRWPSCCVLCPPTIDQKMKINRARKWAQDGTGHGYHVRDKSVAP